ncbi:MAG: response regulator [Nitrospinota bacterium]
MKKYSILLVDDEESILLVLKGYLEKEGYKTTIAESGNKAVEMIEKGYHFDLIFTDLVMDGIDGMGVLKEAKKAHPETIVMILTGYGSLDTAVEAMRLGAFDYLQKPCEKSELLMRTQRGIDHLVLNRKVKAYEKILPVCCVCKKIRDDDGKEPGTGTWKDPDVYLDEKTEIDTSHTYCDEHMEELRKEIKLAKEKHKKEKEHSEAGK